MKKAVVNGETGVWKNKNGIRIFIKDKLTSTETDFKKQAAQMYEDRKQLLEQNKSVLNGVDWNNPTDVENKAIELIHKSTPGDPACYRVVGMIAAMFERKNIPYEVHIGKCFTPKAPAKVVTESNHIWVRNTKNDKIYEHFPRYKTSDLYGHESEHMVNLKKRPKVQKATFKKGAL